MMTSSQVVEIASSSPFGCVLKDHNSRRERRRDHQNQNQNQNTNSKPNFQRNLKELVRDHLHSCISISPKGSSYNQHQDEHDENYHHHQSSSNFSICFGGGGSNSKNNNINNTSNSDSKTRSHGSQNGGSRAAAQKAKDMITTIERQQNQEAEVISLSPSRCSPRGSTFMREPSPAPSDSDISVSSLLQRWRGFEAFNKNGVAMRNNNDEMSTDSSVVSTTTSITLAEGIPELKQENEGRTEEMQGNLEDVEGRAQRKEQQQMQLEDFLSLAGGGEKERMRVSDIVRKWARTGQGVSASDEGGSQDQQQLPFGACLARLEIGMDYSGVNGEQRGVFSHPVVCSPKLRGRQAIADLFMRMERERYKEVESLAKRQAVTKFPQRGRSRIQSLVRLQCLRRGVARKEQQPPQQPTVGSERPQTGSSIISLRERFNITAKKDSSNLRSPRRDTASIKQEVGSTSKSNQSSEQTNTNDNVNNIVIHKETTSNIQEVVVRKAVTIDEPQNATDQENLNLGICQSQTTESEPVAEINLSSAEDSEPENNTCEEEYSGPAPVQTREEEPVQSSLTQIMDQTQVKEVKIVQPSLSQVMEQLHQEIVSRLNSEKREEVISRVETQHAPEIAMTCNGWQEEEEEEEMFDDYQDDHQYFETNLDWIADISRPRSYWEDLRQSWYEEVYNTRSQNEEIRQLLERGSVSAVLASDFKERMDQLMTSTVQRTVNYSGLSGDEDNRYARVFSQSQTPSLIDHQEEVHHDQENAQVLCTEEVEQNERRGGEDDEEHEVVVNGAEENREEEEASSMQQYQDVGDYYDHASSQSQSPSPWGHYADHEASDDSDQAASTPLQQPSLVPSYDHDTQEGSSYKNTSIEMELIYDLRSHMEQLYREMSEIRKSMTSCMDMQVKLQSSIREEVAAAINNNPKSREESKDTKRRRPKKGSCCICYEKKVDSLLYRCGHMCACFDCARELQWSSGKCPICRAQIADVVRAYPDV